MLISDNMQYTYRVARNHVWQPWNKGHIEGGSALWDKLCVAGAQIMYHREGHHPTVYTFDPGRGVDGHWVEGDLLL